MHLRFFRCHRRHRHGHRVRLTVGDVSVLLLPERRIQMATTLAVGANPLKLTIDFLTPEGVLIAPPLAPIPTPDASPVWTSDNLTDSVLTVDAGGLSAQLVQTV